MMRDRIRDLKPLMVTARITRVGVDSSERLGRHRWVVERTIALLALRRLAIYYDCSATPITALATMAFTIIFVRRRPGRSIETASYIP